jgi:hypothetical protein
MLASETQSILLSSALPGPHDGGRLSLLRPRHQVNLPTAARQDAARKEDAFGAAYVELATAFHGSTANLGMARDQ